jgi:hypothetical protein
MEMVTGVKLNALKSCSKIRLILDRNYGTIKRMRYIITNTDDKNDKDN